MAKKIFIHRNRSSRQVVSILYIIIGIIILVRPDIAILLIAIYFIATGILGLLA